MLQSDWLDYGTWIIYTIPYVKRSGLFIWLLIKDKIQDFWEKGRGKGWSKLSTEEREKLVTFGKLSVNFRKLSGKPKTIDHHVSSRVFQ